MRNILLILHNQEKDFHKRSVHCNSLLFVNATKIYQFKAKVSEIKYYALCLENLSKDFTINNLK